MLKLGDLKNRVYEEKTCVRFEVEIDLGEGKIFEVRFDRNEEFDGWILRAIHKEKELTNSQLYEIQFGIPQPNMKLETIAATGLNIFQYYLKQEIQNKMVIDFAIGEITRGM